MIKAFGLILLMVIGQISYGQTDNEEALEKGLEAIRLMDAGKVDESIILLEEAQKLDPDKFLFPYELAFAHYYKEDYDGAIAILETNIGHKDVNEQFFQLLGKSYDALGKTDKALEVFDKGLIKFPKSGMIYSEKGNVYWRKEEYMKALPFYEKGIEVDPLYALNYYQATKLYLGSTQEVWGMIYGEIFMNLELNSKRTDVISALLFDTYKSEIKFTSDTSFSVSFSESKYNTVLKYTSGTDYSVSFNENDSIILSDLKDPRIIKLPFGSGVYEPTLMASLIEEKSIDVNSLDRIRTNFIKIYYKNGSDTKYPNALFDYQNKIQKAGHFEAYNHWILRQGDTDAFEVWYNLNKDKWDAFTEWFTNNELELDDSNKFYSGQY